MIYVTAGHEKSIGTEVFLKSCLTRSQENLNKIIYVSYLDTLKENLELLSIKFKMDSSELALSSKKLNVKILEPNINQTMDTLLYSMKEAQEKDFIFTLPSSKDQFIFEDKNFNGHTDFFRFFYKNNNIPMLFMSSNYDALLLTDHENLFNLKKYLNSEEFIKKIETILSSTNKLKKTYNRIIFSGINPHCGENGLIGSEDDILKDVIKGLELSGSIGPELAPIGPISADAIHTLDLTPKDLVVYFYHDQGLPLFKSNSGLQGINVTCGLPFIRMSVDHGTSFNLYGKNTASTHGTDYVLRELFKL